MGKEKKKTFDVRGVQLGSGRSMDQVATDLTRIMNDLNNDGYSVQVLHVDDGLLAVGRLPADDNDGPVARLIGALTHQLPDALDFPDRVVNLLATLKSKIPGDWETNFENEMPKILRLMLKDAPLKDAPPTVIREIAQECEDCADKHEKTHDPRGRTVCSLPQMLRAIALRMREHAQKNVQ